MDDLWFSGDRGGGGGGGCLFFLSLSLMLPRAGKWHREE